MTGHPDTETITRKVTEHAGRSQENAARMAESVRRQIARLRQEEKEIQESLARETIALNAIKALCYQKGWPVP